MKSKGNEPTRKSRARSSRCCGQRFVGRGGNRGGNINWNASPVSSPATVFIYCGEVDIVKVKEWYLTQFSNSCFRHLAPKGHLAKINFEQTKLCCSFFKLCVLTHKFDFSQQFCLPRSKGVRLDLVLVAFLTKGTDNINPVFFYFASCFNI